jgi:hypothetical protein
MLVTTRTRNSKPKPRQCWLSCNRTLARTGAHGSISEGGGVSSTLLSEVAHPSSSATQVNGLQQPVQLARKPTSFETVTVSRLFTYLNGTNPLHHGFSPVGNRYPARDAQAEMVSLQCCFLLSGVRFLLETADSGIPGTPRGTCEKE